ncbi:hypothetical protein AVEN_237070-1 [Araneus ventricosus]|uniref:Uncharacterized protein n=1 Tax=Araneus ventricosus TaxID=182803 RepID=A0A4Y2N438_ARAVE|nr:hypothetical protein AVEN_237070-1 [Araneus ventricosus]
MELHEQRFYTGKDEYLSLIFTRWRRFHIATMLAAFFSAFCASFSFIAFDSKFSPACPLFAVVRIARYEGNAENLSYILLKKKNNEPGTEWSDAAVCSFVLYTPIIDMLAAISGLLLFCTQAGQSNLRGGFSHNSQLKLVPPTCISGFAVTLLSFVAAIILTLGGGQLCSSFEDTELERYGKNHEIDR